MGISLAKVGEKARGAAPLGRLLENIGILNREHADASVAGNDDETIGEDTAPSPLEGTPARGRSRRLRQRSSEENTLKERLSSWWHGETVRGGQPLDAALEVDATFAADMPEWGSERARVSEALWGENFIEPGSVKTALKLFVPVMPTSKQSVLDLSAGLGGTALALVSSQNLWMDAFEPDPVLALRAKRNIQLSGCAKQIPVEQADFNSMKIEKSRYNLVYARDRLFTHDDKLGLLERIAEGLKTGGQILITDYLLNGEAETETLDAWRGAEPVLPNAWTLGLYARALEQFGLNVWARHNLTQDLLGDIYSGWNKIIGELSQSRFDRALGDHLLREGEIWAARTRALEAGDLVYCRIIAQKE